MRTVSRNIIFASGQLQAVDFCNDNTADYASLVPDVCMFRMNDNLHTQQGEHCLCAFLAIMGLSSRITGVAIARKSSWVMKDVDRRSDDEISDTTGIGRKTSARL